VAERANAPRTHLHAALRAWILAGLLLLVGFTGALALSQRQSRDDIRASYAEHAAIGAGLTEAVLSSSSASAGRQYAKVFGGTRIPTTVLDAWARRTQSLSAVILDARGGVVAASSRTPRALTDALAARPRFVRRVLAGGTFSLSDIIRAGGRPTIQYAVAFRTPAGRRLLVSAFRPQVLYAFFGDYLRRIPNPGGHAYVLDANGVVIGGATSHAARPGSPVHERGLLAAMRPGRQAGEFGSRFFAASAVRGSGWHVVLTAPQSVLFASVSGPRMWLPWLIVFAFGMAAALATVLLLRTRRAAADLRRSQERYALVVQGSNDGIWDRDLETGELYVSPRWREILGLPDDHEARDEHWLALVHPEDIGHLEAQLAAIESGDEATLDLEYRIRHADGSYRWVLVRGALTRDDDGRPVRLAGSMSDVTDRKQAEDRLRDGALHDALTGLANRALFLDRLEVALARTRRDPDRRCAVLFLDVDRFKLINDSYSHAVGDELLVELGRRLTAVLRPGDTIARPGTEEAGALGGTVARLGGDEFTILLDDVRSPEQPLHVAERILRSLEQPFELGERSLSVGASVGIAFSEPDSTAAEMMRNADLAMYQAKRQGSTTSALYNAEMHARVSERLDLEMALRDALDHGTMRVFFQPIVDLATGAPAGFEALARWPAGLPEVGPADFIPVAEETGLIHPLWRVVLDTACRQLARWRADGLVRCDATMSVNVAR
jgi:PAS domain S-box-containing protein